jgi:hypothetical protein
MTEPLNRKVLHRKTKAQRRLFSSLLFWKYVALFVGAIGLALVTDSMINIWFTTREHRADLVRFQKEQATAAAARISQFIREIEAQLGWTTHLSWASPLLEQRELDGLRLMRQVPAITELSLLDDHGREQVRLSRQAMDRRGSNADFSTAESFRVAASGQVYYGPVQFRRETEPYMTLAVAGARRDAGVSIAEVNLKLIWDVVSKIRVGKTGRAYVVDGRGRLIAHPDLSLVLRNTDLSHLAQVRAAWADPPAGALPAVVADMNGQPVLTEFARADPLNWFVFVELPEAEADVPVFAAIRRSLLVLLAGLLLALLAALVQRFHGPTRITRPRRSCRSRYE